MIEHGIVCVLVCSGPDRLVVRRFFNTELVFCGLMMRSRNCDECSMKIKITNDTTQRITMLKGIAGIYSELTECDPGGTMTVVVDYNLTLGVYVATDEARKKLLDGKSLTNGVFFEWAAITFYKTPEDVVSWRGTRKRTSPPKSQVLICIHTPHCMYSRVQ